MPPPFDATPPPPFTEYVAQHLRTANGDIISHDRHLNEDGEALYRFVLAQSAVSPVLLCTCTGSHGETQYRTVSSTHNRESAGPSRMESYSVTVFDFSFTLDLTAYITSRLVHISYADMDPAYRGSMVRQVDAPGGRRKATRAEKRKFKDVQTDLSNMDWPKLDAPLSTDVRRSGRTLRQWADEYASSPKLLKEFVYTKTVHGWDTVQLEKAIIGVIRSTSYSSSIRIRFQSRATKVNIRADNWLSRVLSHSVYKLLLSIVLIYPCIWLYERFNSRGGGIWEIYGGAYFLRVVEPATPDDLERLPHNPSPTLQTRIIDTGEGPKKLTGYQEGEWLREWEEVIRRCVVGRVKLSEPLKTTSDASIPPPYPGDPAFHLDGY